MSQLYTAKGSQGFGVGKDAIESLFIDSTDYKETVIFDFKQEIW